MKRNITLVVVFLSLFFPCVVSAFTPISGTISSDTTWTKEGSPYVVATDFRVREGVTLTIDPGVAVKFEPAFSSYPIIHGRIIARGTPEEKIYFTSIYDDSIGGDTNKDGNLTLPLPWDWFVWIDGFRQTTRPHSSFENVVFSYGNGMEFSYSDADLANIEIVNSFEALRVGGSTITISNLYAHDSSYCAFTIMSGGRVTASSVRIKRCDSTPIYIDNSASAAIDGLTMSDILDVGILSEGTLSLSNANIDDIFGAGIYALEGKNSIERTVITNAIFGVRAERWLPVSSATLVIADSSIAGNLEGISSVSLDSSLSPITVQAANNWWGDASGPFNETLNPDGMGDHVSDYVEFDPWLTSDPNVTEIPLALTNLAETEDDGNQDAKGVADKTNFTFSVTASGNPDTVTLIATSLDNTFISVLSPSGDTYTTTRTFPKGKYTWHIEATAGSQTTQTPDQNFTTGYSNVAFLPGLEASRLYRPATDPTDPSITKVRLWEPPLALQDNAQLYMNPDGTPKTPGIFTGDIVDNAYVFLKGNIYKSFMSSMDDLRDNGTIKDWKAFPYDWRFDVRDIVDHPIALEAGSYSMTEEIQKLAESSDTGKVTLIAHSNGGLVSKVLADRFGADGPKLLDQMIFVASPQAGTPSAVGAILHGFQQGLPFDSFHPVISPMEARTLAKDMPSAYGLLPSAQYFTYVDDAIISFDDNPLLQDWRAKYGIEIHSAERLHNFLADQTRNPMPVIEETKNPIIGNDTLLTSAENLHNNTLDNWAPPPGVTLTEIAGWGEDTLKAIVYYQGVKSTCAIPGELSTCVISPALEYKPKMVLDGDGTVVVPSALWTGGAGRYWVDLQSYGKDNFFTNINRKHADILEVEGLRMFIQNIVQRNIGTLPQYKYISIVAPEDTDNNPRLHFTLHSPLTLDLYDNAGNHTGISTTTGALEENIPGSRYKTFGELKYISAPASTTLQLVMNGYATGSFTLDMEEVLGDTVTASTTFAGIPSSTSTIATITLPDGDIADSSPLSVDENGDGTADLVLVPKLDSIVTLPKPILTVTADNKTIILGSPIPPFSATLSPTPNDVTGTPDCTTTATASSTVGTYPITCTIGTLASNTYDFAFATGTLSVSYRFDGFLQPINDIAYHPTQAQSVFKSGSTVPVKFQLKNSDGTPVQANTLPAFSFQKGNAMSASVDESTYSDPATSGSLFKWDSTSQQYIYNWSTKGITAGYWYKLSAKLDDGKTYSVVVGLR